VSAAPPCRAASGSASRWPGRSLATSSVDPSVEQRILAGLRGSSTASTVVVVAYRRATIALADEVVFVDGGRVLDRGTHEELLVRCEPYRDLVTAYERAEVERAAEHAGDEKESV
jgi:ATP-binding cassette subfamily B protein